MDSLDVWSDRVDPLVGSMLGKDYRVLEPIGLGGMAVVYLVEHQTLRKRFAAKVLSVELAANLEARARFNQEAHAASQLDHENIVNITDFGETGDQRPFFVMELLRGQTLDQRVAEGAMSIEEMVAVSVPVARALAHAHAEGIVHRDVKPENVFLVQRSQGRFGVKVMDFGIAKTPVNTRLTKMGETLGSPRFMSPEACRGDDVDHRADVYSFGVLLYLMMCGRVPFDDDNLLKVLQMQVSLPLPPPRSVNPTLSPALARVIERALAKDPADRHLSMHALLIDLEAALPPGADRLLIETQSGGASSFRVAVTGPAPATASAGSLSAMPTLPRRTRARWLVALPVIAAAAYGSWWGLVPAQTPASSRSRKLQLAPLEVAPAEVAPAIPPPTPRPAAPAVHPPAPAAISTPPAAHDARVEPPARPARPPAPTRAQRVIKRPAPGPAREPPRAGSADPSLDIRLSR
jgi:serine/threonine-protein kinase